MLAVAKPHQDDPNLARAAELASRMSGDDEAQRTFLAIRYAREAINGGDGAAEGERLLLQALRSAEQWARFACK